MRDISVTLARAKTALSPHKAPPSVPQAVGRAAGGIIGLVDVSQALNALKERGDIVAKFAYANWGRQDGATRQMAENAVQMVQRIPSPRGDKNGADINLALDALEMAFTHSHVNAFAIVSGDSDFIPLVNKLKEYGKTVFVVGGKAFTSTILQQNCHEFISFESPALLFKVLTQKRWELLSSLTGAGPVSLREVARRVQRDVKAVHGDVHALLNAGILQKTEDGQIVFPFDAVRVNFVLKAA